MMHPWLNTFFTKISRADRHVSLGILLSVLLLGALSCSGSAPSESESGDNMGKKKKDPTTATTVAKPVPPGTNLVQNSSVESNTAGWMSMFNNSAESCRVQDPNCAHSGQWGLLVKGSKFEWDGVHYGTTNTNQTDDETLAVEPNTTYVVTAWVKGIKDFEGVTVWLSPMTSPNGEQFYGPKTDLTQDWQRIEYTFTTQTEVHYAGIRVIKYNNPQPASFAVDDLTMVKK